MKDEECVNGAKVVCTVNDKNCFGFIGYITDVVRHANGTIDSYGVKDKHGREIGYTVWRYVTSWDIYIDTEMHVESKKQLPSECPCGIMRVDCDYHK